MKFKTKKEKHAPLQHSVRRYITEISIAMFKYKFLDFFA